MNRVNSRNDFGHDDSTINIDMAIIIIIIIIIIIMCPEQFIRSKDGRGPAWVCISTWWLLDVLIYVVAAMRPVANVIVATCY